MDLMRIIVLNRSLSKVYVDGQPVDPAQVLLQYNQHARGIEQVHHDTARYHYRDGSMVRIEGE
ncbi:hypothetical protein D3C76_1658000 [compost metagenome]